MGEPVSLAASIAGLISLGLEVANATQKYVHGVRHAVKDVDEFSQELFALIHVLRQLDNFLRDDGATASKFSQTSVLRMTHSACEQELQAINSKLLKRSEDHSTMKSLSWPFVKKDHQQTIAVLRHQVKTFQYALTIDGW